MYVIFLDPRTEKRLGGGVSRKFSSRLLHLLGRIVHMERKGESISSFGRFAEVVNFSKNGKDFRIKTDPLRVYHSGEFSPNTCLRKMRLRITCKQLNQEILSGPVAILDNQGFELLTKLLRKHHSLI